MAQMLDDLSVQIPDQTRFEMQEAVLVPDIDIETPDKELNNFETNATGIASVLQNINSDQIMEYPLSAREGHSDGSNLEHELSELDRTFWSADISVKLDFKNMHEEHKLMIPMLDLTNLPPDSDDEVVEEQPAYAENVDVSGVQTFGQLGQNGKIQHNFKGGKAKNKVSDLFAQFDALHAEEEDDLAELENEFAFDDIPLDRSGQMSEGDCDAQNNSRLFLESYDGRDSDLLDDHELLELQAARSILEECGISSGKKFDRTSNVLSNLSSPRVD